jgi:CxxC motif-containing protein (DUF1111 family)
MMFVNHLILFGFILSCRAENGFSALEAAFLGHLSDRAMREEEQWMPRMSLQRNPSRHLVVAVLGVGLLGVSWGRLAADDSPAFGEPLPGLTTAEHQAFEIGLEDFLEVETVEDGLGPVFNERSCAACHRGPAIGGDSAVIETRFGTVDKKHFDPLISGGGSLMQAHGIGRVGECLYVGETLPPTTTIVAGRKTTPLFGLGFIEAIPDNDLHQMAAKQPKDIKGTVHQVKDVGQPTRPGRFGHKAQVATLLQFSGDAYLNEMGITSPHFPQENCPNGDCALLRCDPVQDPEDDGSSVIAFADFMRLLAAPPRGPITAAVQAGELVFARLGCAGCHVPTWTAGPSPVRAISGVTFHPYSDFLLHDMGDLGDGIEQGKASGAEMRTMPLWGLRVRQSFLHDGRADSIEEAILGHEGQGDRARQQFRALTPADVEALMAFLQSL